jgi:hypothetical protein
MEASRLSSYASLQPMRHNITGHGWGWGKGARERSEACRLNQKHACSLPLTMGSEDIKIDLILQTRLVAVVTCQSVLCLGFTPFRACSRRLPIPGDEDSRLENSNACPVTGILSGGIKYRL